MGVNFHGQPYKLNTISRESITDIGLTRMCLKEHGYPYKLNTIPTESITHNPTESITHNPTKSITHNQTIEDILSRMKNIK
jgi:hypothetical protein